MQNLISKLEKDSSVKIKVVIANKSLIDDDFGLRAKNGVGPVMI